MCAMQRAEEEQQATVAAKQEQHRMHSSHVEITKLQLIDLTQKRDAAASEAQQCRDAIRGKADVAKQEREKYASIPLCFICSGMTHQHGHRFQTWDAETVWMPWCGRTAF